MLTDADSLMYEIEVENLYEDFQEIFDFSNYPKYSKYYDNVNNFVASKMMNEICGKLIKD